MDVLALLQKKQRCTSVHRCFLSRKVSLFEQFLKKLIHLLIETFEKPFAEYERVIVHYQQVYDIHTFIIGKYKGVIRFIRQHVRNSLSTESIVRARLRVR